MSNPITIKDIDFDRIDSDTIECWVDGDCVGKVAKHIPRGLTSLRNSAGPQSGAHQWMFIHNTVKAPTVLNEGGNLRDAKKQALVIINAERG